MRESSRHSYVSQSTYHSTNTDDSGSHGSSVSGTESRANIVDTRKRGLWSTMRELIVVTMSANLSTLLYENYALENIEDSGTTLQIFIAFIVVGIPASYMQMALGQFTHMGVFLLKRMAPIADGAGFSYCITILFASLFAVLNMESICLYFILSMVPGPLQWSTCGSPNCHDVHKPCNQEVPCINQTVHLAAYSYWNHTYMRGVTPISERRIALSSGGDLWMSVGSWLVIYLISLVSMGRLKKVVHYATACHLIIKGIMALMVVTVAGPIVSFTTLTVMSIQNLSNLNAWKEAVRRVVVLMTLGDFNHVIMGALSSDSVKIGTASFLSGLLSFTSLLLDDILVNAASIALCERLHLEFNNRNVLFHPSNAPMHLTLIPTVFELLKWPRVWNFLYFANKALAIIFRVIFNILFLHESVSHRFPTLSSYRRYTSPIFCFLAFGFSCLFQEKESYDIVKNFKRVVIYFCQYFNVFFFAAMVSYVYGMRRFCDDIHFLRRLQPNLYWKLVWALLPILLLVTLSFECLDRNNNEFFYESLFEIIIIFSPYLCLTTFEVIKKIIEKKTITLITPEARWGPREIERRARRRVFNPRKATRYMVGMLQCNHVCLTENKILRRLVIKEAEMISRLGGPQTGRVHHVSSSTQFVHEGRFSDN